MRGNGLEDKSFVSENQIEIEKGTLLGKVTDLPQLVEQLLDHYDQEGHLTRHDGAIPDNEVWVKIGGDHGGGSFKYTLQIANLKNTNSKHNTCLLVILDCKDSPDNLL